jgi:hypothetical protein
MRGSPSLVPGRSPLQLSTTGAEAIGGHSSAAWARNRSTTDGSTRRSNPARSTVAPITIRRTQDVLQVKRRGHTDSNHLPLPRLDRRSGWVLLLPGMPHARRPCPATVHEGPRAHRSALRSHLHCVVPAGNSEHFRILLQFHPRRCCSQRESRAQIARIQAWLLHPAEGTAWYALFGLLRAQARAHRGFVGVKLTPDPARHKSCQGTQGYKAAGKPLNYAEIFRVKVDAEGGELDQLRRMIGIVGRQHAGRGPRSLGHGTALLDDADTESVSCQFERGGEANNTPSPDDDIYSLHSSIVG